MLITPSLDISINEDFLIGKVDPHEKRYGGIILGLRAGYRTSFSSNAWMDGNWNKLDNMPSYTNNSFYLSISVGSGGFAGK
jgi:hypothetical protein